MVKGQQESPFHRLRKALKKIKQHTKQTAWCMAGLRYLLLIYFEDDLAHLKTQEVFQKFVCSHKEEESKTDYH